MQFMQPEAPWGLFPDIGTYDQGLWTLGESHGDMLLRTPGARATLLLEPGGAFTSRETEFTRLLEEL